MLGSDNCYWCAGEIVEYSEVDKVCKSVDETPIVQQKQFCKICHRGMINGML